MGELRYESRMSDSDALMWTIEKDAMLRSTITAVAVLDRAPDLKWTNNTPYGIMVWTSYTDTSITVTLYSTQYAFGQQTGQTEGRSGSSCTTVTTTRTITFPDGHTETDTVGATYRDSGARTCNG